MIAATCFKILLTSELEFFKFFSSYFFFLRILYFWKTVCFFFKNYPEKCPLFENQRFEERREKVGSRFGVTVRFSTREVASSEGWLKVAVSDFFLILNMLKYCAAVLAARVFYLPHMLIAIRMAFPKFIILFYAQTLLYKNIFLFKKYTCTPVMRDF